MITKKRIIIDIRSPEELLEKRLISYSDDTILMFIPVSHIRYNQEMIKQLSLSNTIYILCKKAKRSSMIKKTFFPNDRNIISINGGINELEKMHEIMRGLKVIVYKIRVLNTKKKLYMSKKYIYYILYLIILLIFLFKDKLR